MISRFDETTRQLDEIDAHYRALVTSRPETFLMAERIEVDASLFQLRRTTTIIEAFGRGAPPSDDGYGWLIVFGVFQAMYVNCSALRRLSRVFRIPAESLAKLARIENARNASVGHPIERNQGKDHKGRLRSAYYVEPVAPGSMDVFRLRRVRYSDKVEQSSDFDLIELIETLQRTTGDVLDRIAAVLRRKADPAS